MGRPLRVIQNIYPYHLVCRTNNRTFRFDQREVIRIFFKALKETHEKYNILIHHVVLMTNHYHIIDTDEYYLACVRYIYRNPKRAGMVDDLEEFSDSSFNFWAFGKEIDVFLVEDHLVMRWGKKRVREYFRILVLSEEGMFTDDQVKKGLRRMFFGSADFMQRMHDTHCCQQ